MVLDSPVQGNLCRRFFHLEFSECRESAEGAAVSCGVGCGDACPNVSAVLREDYGDKLDADGLVYLDSDVVPLGLEEEAREGAAACPAEAITVEAII